MNKMVKLEALIAWPPTSKCREMIAVLEEVVRRYPDRVKLVVFERGMREYREKPSAAMAALIHKGSLVPVCLVDGALVCRSQVPTLEDLEAKVQEALRGWYNSLSQEETLGDVK